jgi:tartrate dehydratase alpha subunit/fumarate hydratase class I-like protein
MSILYIDSTDFDRLQNAMKEYSGNVEEAINEVLHNEAGADIEEAVRRLMPVSGRRWKGKKPAAKTAKSLRQLPANLSITVKSAKSYQYLYFPNDGGSTNNHAGQQFFFEKGGEIVTPKVVDRCITKLIENFE